LGEGHEQCIPAEELVPGDEVLAVVHSDHAAALAALLGFGSDRAV
jgi:hypothetical protein